jgi:hypothetical protein
MNIGTLLPACMQDGGPACDGFHAQVRKTEEWNGKHQLACLEIERLRDALKKIARTEVLPFGHPVREIAHIILDADVGATVGFSFPTPERPKDQQSIILGLVAAKIAIAELEGSFIYDTPKEVFQGIRVRLNEMTKEAQAQSEPQEEDWY